MATAQEKAAKGIIVGVQALTGQKNPRQRVDIDVLLTEQPETFNLFLLALSELQKDKGLLGYYQLAGMHGLPTNTWNGVDRKFQDIFGGYCAHGVLIFPTWHRPYLALLEQTIYLKMVEIANSFNVPYRQTYLNAAAEFRLPYFDYFRPRGGQTEFPGVPNNGTTTFPFTFRLPDIFNQEKIALRKPPQDQLEYNLDNPLYTYKFTEKSGEFSTSDKDRIKGSYSTTQTVRHPDGLQSTTHNLGNLSNALNSGREGRVSLIFDLVNSKPYGDLSTVASDRQLARGDMTAAPDLRDKGLSSSHTASGSLEGIHGAYHGLIGGPRSRPGHMSDPRIAAFDPVFWFHHCQIDRLWALWQAMHPKEWFPQASNPKSDNWKDLLPFYKDKVGSFYNSDNTINTTSFGYYYDDFKDFTDKETLYRQFQEKYIWSSRLPDSPRIDEIPVAMRPLNVKVQASHFFKKAPVLGSSAPATTTASIKHQVVSATGAVSSKVAVATEAATVQAQAALGAGQGVLATPETKKTVKIDPKFDREWYADSIVRRSAANGTFTIYFFLALPGQVDSGSDDFYNSPYLAGISHIFAAPRETCDNCGDLEAAGQLARGTAPITPLLLDYLNLPDNGLDSLRPEHVEPFLVKYLRWRVFYTDEGQQDPRNVPDLQIQVSAKIYHDDGTKTYDVYPQVVADILHNASPTADS